LGGIRGLGSIAVILWAALLLLGSISAAAVDRTNGNSWTYDMTTSVDVGEVEVGVNGTLIYEQVESRSLSTEAGNYEVNVMRLDGELSGSKYLFGELIASANVTLDGFMFETASGGGIVKEDLHSLTSSTIGTGAPAKSILIEKEIVTTYAPPLLSMFEASWQLGESWSETATTRSVSTTWENGAMLDPAYDNRTVTYAIVVAPISEYVESSAYAFNSERITLTESSGDHRILWWSNTADNFVKMEYYRGNSSEPYTTLILREWQYADSGNAFIFYVGLASVVIASIVLAAVIKKYGPRDRRPPPPDPHSIREVHDVMAPYLR